jgi:predicted nucleic acid-binding protein
VILVDTSGLLALLDSGEPDHTRCQAVATAAGGPLITTDLVLAEADFLVVRRLGVAAERAFLDQVIAGAVAREPVRDEDFERAREIVGAYADQSFGLTDSTLMALAERLDTPVLTLDVRHFGVFRTRRGKTLDIRP